MSYLDEVNRCETAYSLSYAVSAIELFKNGLKYKNRFFLNDDLFFNDVKECVDRAYNNEDGPFIQKEISTSQFLYRARLINKIGDRYITDYERFKKNVGIEAGVGGPFYGYPAEECLAPPPYTVPSGRLNPQYIQMLYTSSKPKTSLMEVRPIINSQVSIAKIKVKSNLRILKIKSEIKFSDDEDDMFSYMINRLFSTPSNGTFDDYLPVQYITEYIKSTQKFDGIEFQSSLDRDGTNIVVFDQNKCEAINSKVFLVREINYLTDSILPID